MNHANSGVFPHVRSLQFTSNIHLAPCLARPPRTALLHATFRDAPRPVHELCVQCSLVSRYQSCPRYTWTTCTPVLSIRTPKRAQAVLKDSRPTVRRSGADTDRPADGQSAGISPASRRTICDSITNLQSSVPLFPSEASASTSSAPVPLLLGHLSAIAHQSIRLFEIASYAVGQEVGLQRKVRRSSGETRLAIDMHSDHRWHHAS